MSLSAALRQAVLFGGTRLAGFVLSAASTLVLARGMSVESFGYYASALAVVALANAGGVFGLDQLFLAGTVSLASLRRGIWLIALVIGGACSGWALLVPGLDAAARPLLIVLGWASALEALRSPWLLVPQALGKFAVRGRRELVSRAFVLVVVLIAVLAGAAAEGAAVATLVAQGALTAASLLWPQGSRCSEATVPVQTMRNFAGVIRAGLPFAASSALYVAYVSIDGVLLALLGSASDNAQYKVAFTFFSVGTVGALAINNEVFRPALYSLQRSKASVDRTRWSHLVRKFLTLNLWMGGSAGVGLILSAPTITFLAFGDPYRKAGTLAVVLALAVPLNFFNGWAGNVMIASNRINCVLWVQVGLLGLNIGANAILIPPLGALGAASCTVGTEVAGAFLYWILGVRKFHVHSWVGDVKSADPRTQSV